MSEMFCDTCIGVLQHHNNVVELRTYEQNSNSDVSYVQCGHHLTCKSLIAAADKGCPVCRPTWESLSGPQQNSLRAFGSIHNADTNPGPPSGFITFARLSRRRFSVNFFTIAYNSIWFPELSDGSGAFILERQCDSSTTQYTTTHASSSATSTYMQDVSGKNNLTTDHTSSTASLQIASTWLRNCIQSHHQCNIYQTGTPWYPTRLLYLVDPHGDEGYIRLISTAEKLPNGPYATLSHRWGSHKPLQLTQAMALHPDHRFSMAEMPKTFQEAIQVSRSLGIRYLWIDSLCIIQEGDNLRDWYHEAGLMDKVYLHSHLNIYAADAIDSTKGLFRYRRPIPLDCQHVTVNFKDIDPGPELVDCQLTDSLLWSRNLTNSPLSNRGWVLQERYLAPRILYFCQNQLIWECHEHTACETSPHGVSEIVGLGEKSWARIGQSASGLQSRNIWISCWHYGILSSYSKMDLTVSRDKLIALSGIAKFFMARMNDTYVAGMWRSQLVNALLWNVDRSHLKPRPLVYRSPSWSWASVDGDVSQHWWNGGQKRIQVMDVVLAHATEDTTGAVTDGWLDLRGVLKPLRVCESKESDVIWRIALANTAMSTQHDTVEEKTCMITGVHLDFLPESYYFRHEENVPGRLFCMPCRIDKELNGFVVCLLFKLVDEEKMLFERFGMSWTDKPQEKEQLLADLDEGTRTQLPCLRYENGLHTIRII